MNPTEQNARYIESLRSIVKGITLRIQVLDSKQFQGKQTLKSFNGIV